MKSVAHLSQRYLALGVWFACGYSILYSPVFAGSVPIPFQFPDRNDAPPGSVQFSDPIIVEGIDQAVTISVSGAHYSIDGRTYTGSIGTVAQGATVRLRVTASAQFATAVTAALTVGGHSGPFNVRTADTPIGVPTPSAFKLDKLYVADIDALQSTTSFLVPTGIETRSAVVTVKGLGGTTAPISILGGRYSINGTDPIASDGVIKNGSTVVVSASAPAGSNDASSTTLTIGARAASLNLFTHIDTAAATPTTLSGTQTHVVRDWGAAPQRSFVYKPKGWTAADQRTAFVFFFGGGWTSGEPSKSVSWAKWAAGKGMVGIAPDYRTNERFGTTPLAAVDDARAAVRWVQEQAASLGVDPAKVVVGGISAGGHLALWTAIPDSPPGSDAATAPLSQPAAIVLLSAVSDTSVVSGYTPQRFGVYADALNPQARLSPWMPPTLAFHGDADITVPVTQSSRLCDLLRAAGNFCEFVNVAGGTHSYRTQPGLSTDWKVETNNRIEKFLREQSLLP